MAQLEYDDPLVAEVVAAMPCAKMTLSTYLQRWHTIRLLLAPPETGALADVAHVMLHPGVHYKALRVCAKTTATLSSYICAIKAMFKHGGAALRLRLPDPPTETDWAAARVGWNEAFLFCQATLNAQAKMSAPSERQAAVYSPYNEVVALYHTKAAEKAKHATLTSSQALVLLSFYAHQEPKRTDLGDVHLLWNASELEALDAINNKANYILMDSADMGALLMVRSHKTAKTNGDLEEPLKTQLILDLRASLQRHPRSFLFVGREGTPRRHLPLTNNMYTQLVHGVFKRLTGRATGCNAQRHAAINALDYASSTEGELQAVATRMGHSLPMQRKYRYASAPLPL